MIYSKEIMLKPFEATLLFSAATEHGNPVQLSDGWVAVAPPMPTRRRVSIEEFEADMALARKGRRIRTGQ